MSYWFYVETDTGGPEWATVEDSFNCTSNNAPLWRFALGRGIRELRYMRCADALPLLRAACAYMRYAENQDRLRALEPSNGWGGIESALDVLDTLRGLCERHPNARINMSY